MNPVGIVIHSSLVQLTLLVSTAEEEDLPPSTAQRINFGGDTKSVASKVALGFLVKFGAPRFIHGLTFQSKHCGACCVMRPSPPNLSSMDRVPYGV